MAKFGHTTEISRIARALAVIVLAVAGSLCVSGGAVCEGIVWSTGEPGTSAPQGKVLSDSPGYWGECVLTGVERKEEPVAGEQFQQWRLSIGALSRKPAVWSRQPTFGYITSGPRLPAVGISKTRQPSTPLAPRWRTPQSPLQTHPSTRPWP